VCESWLLLLLYCTLINAPLAVGLAQDKTCNIASICVVLLGLIFESPPNKDTHTNMLDSLDVHHDVLTPVPWLLLLLLLLLLSTD
jgi:hypothetical protein